MWGVSFLSVFATKFGCNSKKDHWTDRSPKYAGFIFLDKSFIGVVLHKKHHSWNVKITKVLTSDLKYKDVWANKFKNVLPNKRYNIHAMFHKQVKFIFIDGNNNEQILKFKFVFLFLHDNGEIMM